MSIRIRVYPQADSIGARRNRTIRRQSMLVQQQRQQLANLRLQQTMLSSVNTNGYGSSFGRGYGSSFSSGYGLGYGTSLPTGYGYPTTVPASMSPFQVPTGFGSTAWGGQSLLNMLQQPPAYAAYGTYGPIASFPGGYGDARIGGMSPFAGLANFFRGW